ncbi:MAG: preprotein translocase subunit SecG [Prevotella sp.]|uniref:preprotein translocase subunit SecG n=1 Tax=Prevotella sp. TaxID=59823 RepID=UPI002A298939|nr:preprotein translocase subunit SecG [Prevotella sp.]MDD7318625.1 preprotein translocase subunit SecG [Prevotellaceae bacterium]MDY4019419.1 preprotein translocase subunit SecG [Prevotella sp.]
MYTLFLVLIILAAVLMIGIVLIQESKGGGLASNFSSSNAIMGVRKTTDFVEKATWGLAIGMVLFSIICAWTAPTATGSQSVLQNTQTQAPQANPNNVQGFGASDQQAAPAAQGAQGQPAENKTAPEKK